MEGQTESPANPKRKEKREKEENQNTTNHGLHRRENKRKKRKRRERCTLERKKWGTPLHTAHRKKVTASENSKQVKEEFLRKNKDISAKIRKQMEKF